MNRVTLSFFSKTAVLITGLLFFNFNLMNAQTCKDFNSGLNNWGNGGTQATVSIGQSSPTTDGTPYMAASDLAGTSWATAPNVDVRADMTCRRICFNYKVFNDGLSGDIPVNPRFTIYTGNSITNPIFRATFTAPPLSENDPWDSICVDLLGDTPPANWTMDIGTPADWPALIANVNGFGFTTDVAIGNTANEQIGVDNFCIVDIPINGCEDFDNGLADWGNGGTAAVVVSTANAPTADGTPYMQASDLAGPSSANITNACPMDLSCSQICFDYKVFNDGWPGDSPVNLRFSIFSGGTLSNPTLSAVYVGPLLSENDGWENFCINFLGDTPPDGWTMTVGTPADWPSLVSSIDGFAFSTDVAIGNTAAEVIGVDNFCIEDLSADGCNDFNDGTGGWSNGGTLSTVTTSSAAPTADNTPYLMASDLAGTSWATTMADTVCGDLDLSCAQICFDYKVIADGYGGDIPVNLIFRIFSGSSITSPNLSATFTGPLLSENDPWQTFCLTLTSGDLPPANWTMDGGAPPTDWASLISNISGFGFTTDVAIGNTAGEIIGVDNFCITEGEAPCEYQLDCHFEDNFFCILDADGNIPINFQWVSPVFPDPNGHCQATTGLIAGDLLIFIVDGVEHTLIYDCGVCECEEVGRDQLDYSPCISSNYCLDISFEFSGTDGATVNFNIDQLNSTPGFTLTTPLPLIVNNGVNTFELCFDYTGECLKDIQLSFSGEFCDGNGGEKCIIQQMITGLYCCDEIPSCKTGGAPTDLNAADGMLSWTPVADAAYYQVIGTTGGKTSCDCYDPLPVQFLLQTTSTSIAIPNGFNERCFEWIVIAFCEDGSSYPSDPVCYYPGRSGERQRQDSSIDNQSGLRVYPNPAKQHLYFDIMDQAFSEEMFEVQIVNIAGQILDFQRFQTTQGQIDISKLPEGYYLFRFTNSAGKVLFKKVMILDSSN